MSVNPIGNCIIRNKQNNFKNRVNHENSQPNSKNIPIAKLEMGVGLLGCYLPHHYTASQPTKPRLEFSPPWKPQISYHLLSWRGFIL